MDFNLVIKSLIKELEADEVTYALIGGFAMGLWGVTRATRDMDFLVLTDDIPKLEAVLGKFAFRREFTSENVSHYVSDLKPYGQIDVLHAKRATTRGMLERRVYLNYSTKSSLPTLEPEDIIGLKIQAISNQPQRASKDLDDAQLLLRRASELGREIDWQRLEDYFSLFNQGDAFTELRENHARPD